MHNMVDKKVQQENETALPQTNALTNIHTFQPRDTPSYRVALLASEKRKREREQMMSIFR